MLYLYSFLWLSLWRSRVEASISPLLQYSSSVCGGSPHESNAHIPFDNSFGADESYEAAGRDSPALASLAVPGTTRRHSEVWISATVNQGWALLRSVHLWGCRFDVLTLLLSECFFPGWSGLI